MYTLAAYLQDGDRFKDVRCMDTRGGAALAMSNVEAPRALHDTPIRYMQPVKLTIRLHPRTTVLIPWAFCVSGAMAQPNTGPWVRVVNPARSSVTDSGWYQQKAWRCHRFVPS